MKTWGVVGSRSFNDYSLLKIVLDNNRPDIIVSGGASGTDSMARRYAQENSIKLVEHLPDYDKFGKGAPLLRNKSIVKDSDHVIAFWMDFLQVLDSQLIMPKNRVKVFTR